MGEEKEKGPPGLDIAGKSMLEILAQIDLFSGLPATHLRRIVDIGVEETYKPSAHVFNEGEPGARFHLILQGAGRISLIVPSSGQANPALAPPRPPLSEMSLIDDAPRSATAVCHEKCRLFCVNRRDLEDLLFVDRDLAYELLWNWVRPSRDASARRTTR